MSQTCQNAKYSLRANVFRFALELEHCPVKSALRICATTGNQNPTRRPALPVTMLLESVIALYSAEANIETCLPVFHSTRPPA
jgi:hypothetical protein